MAAERISCGNRKSTTKRVNSSDVWNTEWEALGSHREETASEIIFGLKECLLWLGTEGRRRPEHHIPHAKSQTNTTDRSALWMSENARCSQESGLRLTFLQGAFQKSTGQQRAHHRETDGKEGVTGERVTWPGQEETEADPGHLNDSSKGNCVLSWV